MRPATVVAAAFAALALYVGLAAAFADQYAGVDLTFGMPSGIAVLIAAVSTIASAVLFFAAGDPAEPSSAAVYLIALGIALMIVGSWFGLFVAPPERFMGEVQRIMYVHVPTAWNALLAMTFALVSAIAFLFRNDWRWDARLEAAIEVGVLLGFLLCCQGAIWAKPTWGVWWDWDPRLTTTAVLIFAFLGILALRRFVEDPVKRGVWSSVATIIAYVDVPIVYFSVKWWNSLHQLQSTPSTVSKPFWIPLRANAFGILFLMLGFILIRARIASLRTREELAVPPLAEAGEVA